MCEGVEVQCDRAWYRPGLLHSLLIGVKPILMRTDITIKQVFVLGCISYCR